MNGLGSELWGRTWTSAITNAGADAPLSCVVVRSGQEPVVVNLDIPVVEQPEEVRWVDDLHPA